MSGWVSRTYASATEELRGRALHCLVQLHGRTIQRPQQLHAAADGVLAALAPGLVARLAQHALELFDREEVAPHLAVHHHAHRLARGPQLAQQRAQAAANVREWQGLRLDARERR